MSGNGNPKIGATKRSSSPSSDTVDYDSAPPEKKVLSGDKLVSGSPGRLAPHTSNWVAYGEDNVLDKLLLDKRYITLRDDNLTGFLTEEPAYFQFKGIPPNEQADLDTYFETLDTCIHFDVPDAPVKVRDTWYQYGGYGYERFPDSKIEARREGAFSQFENCFSTLESAPDKMRSLGHLIQYSYYAMDFIRAATKFLMSPLDWEKRAFEDLFHVFCRLSGVELHDAGREVPRQFEIFGQMVTGKPDFRAYAPLDTGSWWRRKPVTHASFMPKKHKLSAVVEVKLSPPEDTGSIEQETEKYLGQVVGEMLAELLSSDVEVPVAVSSRTHMLGVLVLSTKVYFVVLHIPLSLLAMYRNSSARSCQEEDVKRGTVLVTQGFDFMKRKTRLDVLRILHKIGTIEPM